MSLKVDELGTYDDSVIPEGLAVPLHVDPNEDAIVGDNNVILFPYSIGTRETSVKLHEKRKAEFVVRMANSELIVRKDKSGNDRVFRRVSQSMKNGRIVMEFEEVRQAVNV